MFSMFFVYLIMWRPPPDDSSHKRRPQQGPRQVFFPFFCTTNVYLQLRVIWTGTTRIMTMQLPPPLPTPGIGRIAWGGSRVETQLRPENPCTLNNFRKATLSLSCLILSFNMSKIVYTGTTLTKYSIFFYGACACRCFLWLFVNISWLQVCRSGSELCLGYLSRNEQSVMIIGSLCSCTSNIELYCFVTNHNQAFY